MLGKIDPSLTADSDNSEIFEITKETRRINNWF